MIAPHSLALHGNLAGAWGRWLPLGLASAAAVYLFNLRARTRMAGGRDPLADEATAYRRRWGALPALVVPLAGRLLTALAGATGLLVTAGFAFNETFLYWFPNFAFAFLLLGVVVLIHACGPRFVHICQQLFIWAALGGLLVLLGVAAGGPGGPPLHTESGGAGLPLHSWPLLLLLFVGVDLVFLHGPAVGKEWNHTATIGVLAATLLLALWGWVAVRFVPPERLVDTTIAPVLVAKQIWGQAGRYTMGVVTIAGTLAAVNALFSIVAATINGGLRALGGGRLTVPTAAVVTLLGGVTAAMMALGLAGTEAIDMALRAGLICWLLHYALGPLLALMDAPAILAGGAILAGAGVLVFFDPDRGLVLIFMLAGMAAAAVVAGGLWWGLQRRWANLQKRSMP